LSPAELRPLAAGDLNALRAEIEARFAPAPAVAEQGDDVQKSVARLVLSLVEFVRQLMERQAVRRMEAETLDAGEVESLGVALMKLEETVHDIAGRFGLDPEDLNLDLGPLGRLR
jgi:hypothetical protein